jgi:rhamnose transport system ATP-binding protein
VTALLTATAIAKSYAGVRALKGVTFDVHAGEVHALVGENGAGKSTLIKIMTGAENPDAGTLAVDGRLVDRMDPATSRALGIAAIYQQPTLFPHLSVAENIALSLDRGYDGGDRFRRRMQWIDWRGRSAHAAELLARLGADIAPTRLVETLSLPEQQLVEIAKAIGADARILIMDEPTAPLTGREVDRLLDVVRRLRASGSGIVYISHRLEEVCALADRVTVLRDGETVDTLPRERAVAPELIRLMVGRELSTVFPKRDVALGDIALEIRDVWSGAAGIRGVSLTLRRGEILGLSGLVGSGRTELAETIFGLRPVDRGSIVVAGVPSRVRSPAAAIALGLAYVPEDRRRHGVVLEMPVATNATLASLRRVSRRGLLHREAERALAQHYVDRLRIKTSSVWADTGTLSGGNQQKVALARWLATTPAVLMLDEPTQGVDVGAKAEIHGLMQDLAEQGLAILMISSELPEILGMSDRIAVMRHGAVAGVLSRAEATPEAVMSLALASTPVAQPA